MTIRMQHFINSTGTPEYTEIARGEGIYIWDTEGRRYLDGSSGAVAANIGHGDPRVKAAIVAQLDRVAFAYGRAWESAPNRELAARLVRLTNWGYEGAFFVSGGTECTESALKFARQVALSRGQNSRWKVISREPSYHGSTLAVMGVTGDPQFSEPFSPMFVKMPKVSAPFTYRTPGDIGPEANAIARIAELRQCILDEGPDSVLAVIIEPVGGTATGALVATPIYYTELRQVCDEFGLLLIFDEIMCGAGRTGKFLAAHHWPDCRPDIVLLAKGVSGAYAPFGAMMTSSDLVEPIRRMGGFMHGHTYAANPLSCAAANAVLQVIEDDGLINNAAVQGARLHSQLEALKTCTRVVGDVRGIGLQLALEIVADQATKRPFPASFMANEKVRAACLARGLSLLSRRLAGGRYGEWLMVCPPLTITAAQVEELVEMLADSLYDFERTTAESS